MEEELTDQSEDDDDRDCVSEGPEIAASRLTSSPGTQGILDLSDPFQNLMALSAACLSASRASVEQHCECRVHP